ncbi:MAG TPA: DUF1365 family protein [Acidimicrobiales bacterium]|nr:DUF1365 family protein [Acidimicrobiales bacterium]
MSTVRPVAPGGQAQGLGLSAVYEGVVTHRRPGPSGRAFTYRVTMPLLGLGELDELCRVHPLWSCRAPAPAWIRRGDFLGDPRQPLEGAVRDLVAARTGRTPEGPVCLLANPRLWGWQFNPISCYFCLDPAGRQVEALVAEVTNTPWHQRHCYVVGPPGTYLLDKRLHVSPFLGPELSYRLSYEAPAESLKLSISVAGEGGEELWAAVALRRRRADRPALASLVWRPWLGAPGVSARIYRQAGALWLAGYRFHRHPGRRRHRRLAGSRGG